MGEPLEAVEGSDSEISRLFPKCRPRSATNTPTTTPTDVRRSDLNLNCVLDSDDNDNYEPLHTTGDLPRLYDNSKLSRDSGSSGRMSVDSGSGSRSGSTPGSRSDSHSESKMERSAEDVDMDMDVSVVSAYDDYEDRYMRSSVLDSSYEEAPQPPPTTTTTTTTRHQPQRREHFRLRDSRIEIAGGREVFSHSRSRPARRRHDESQRRRGQQPQNQQYQQERQQQEQNWPESPGDSEGRSHGCSVRESPLVYETRLTGSSEVVFDDIGEWVARGLTVRALDDRPGTPSSPTAELPVDPAEHGDHGYLAAYERSTSPSDSDSTQESTTHKVTKIGNVPIAEYEGSPRRYGPRPSPRNHSPRGGNHAPPPRPPRPGFPRRVLAEEEAARESSCEPPTATSSEANAPQGDERDVTPQEDPSSDLPGPDSCSEADSVSPAPPVIAISTLTSSYSENLTTQPTPTTLDTDMYDYSYEMSETRKVLEEFFKEQGGRGDDFLDLEYHLKRQQGNSYVGLRLAAEYGEDQSLAEGGDQQQLPPPPSSDLLNDDPDHLNNSLDHHKSGSELHNNSPEVQNNPGELHNNDSEHHNANPELHDEDVEQQSDGPDQQPRPLDQRTGPSADVSAENDQELGTPTHEVSSASPRLLNHHLDLSYEAQQDTAQEQHPAPDSISISSNNSIHSSNSMHSDAGGQEILGDNLPESPQDPFPESSALYDRLNEVVVAALRDCHLDDRSGDENPGPGSCTEDLSGHEDPGLLDLSTEGDHDTASTNPQTEELAETEVGLQVGHSRNFTLSPETTSCDSGDVESDYSGVDPEGSIHSSSRGICSAMPVLEDGLSSGDESGMEVPEEEEEESKDSLFEQDQEQLQQELLQQQRPVVRSLDEQLCRGELPPLNPLPTLNSHNSPLPNAASSPHTKIHSRNSPHTNAQSPSSSTLKLMKKQITEIEREIAMRRPEGGPRRGGHDGEGPQPPLDLHLLDPLNEKMPEPPPPPAPHPHRGGSTGNSTVVENGSSSSTPNQMPAVSPSHVLGHLHSPQYTPVSGPSTGPHLLSAMGSLTSPVQHKVTPHMVPGHPAAHDIHHNPGGGVGQSRESVEAAIADIKQAIRRTKNLPVKSHPQDRSPINDKAPVWIPRNSRREPQQLQQQQQQPNSGQQSQQQSPQQHQQLEAAAAEATRSPDHVRPEDDDGDTDQETDRLLGQQRSDDPGFYDEKGWRRPKTRTVMPRATNHKANGGGATSNGSTPSTPIGQNPQVSTNQTPSSPPDMASTNKNKNKKEKEANKKKGRSKEVLIEGVLFRARYLGSTQLVSEGQPTKTTRMMQAEEAVSRIKALAPDGESQPSTEVDLFISTEKIMVLNTDLKEIMMDHALRTISYIADIGDLVVLMARRRVLPTDDAGNNIQKAPKMICHVFESDEAQFIAQSIGQAFQVAYLEFLKANGIEDHSFVKEMDYQEVLNSQEIFGDELQMFAKKELQKEVVVPKMKSEILGVVVVESGWGSMVPTVVIANLSPTGAAAKCGQLNIGDQIIAINGVSLVGLPLSTCQNYIKNTKYNTAVKLTVVPCPPVVEVKIRRPDTKYQLGFSVQNGVICSLLRGGIAERGGVRVGHRIIDINSQSVVAVPHEKIVNLLATSVGEIRMKTMPTSIFRLLTGQETPQYI